MNVFTRTVICAALLIFSKMNYLGALVDYKFLTISPEKVILTNNILFGIGTIATAILLSWDLHVQKKTTTKYREQHKNLIANYKSIMLEGLKHVLGLQSLPEINIRIFTHNPKQKTLDILNIEGLAYVGTTKGLSFNIDKKEGLVSACYTQKHYILNTDLQNKCDPTMPLSNQQTNQTANLRFCLCIPLFKENKIDAIVALDSIETIDIPSSKEKKVVQIITTFCETLKDLLPETFKGA